MNKATNFQILYWTLFIKTQAEKEVREIVTKYWNYQKRIKSGLDTKLRNIHDQSVQSWVNYEKYLS